MDLVDIVLATYNGEKYLCEQIDSLIGQTHTNWRLLVSDDGSTDHTVAILNKYVKADMRISIVNIERQGGVVQNFFKALCFSTAHYVMFCDQDDIWFSDKIASMLESLKKIEFSQGKDIPVLGFSDLSLVDERGQVIHNSFYLYNKLDPQNNLNYGYLLWRSTVYGCTVIFNKALLNRAMPFPEDVPMHDQWFALIAAKFGVVFFSPESKIFYRQHSNNAVGGVGTGWLGKLISMKKLYTNIKKAALTCINQWNFFAIRCRGVDSKNAENIIDLNSLRGRIRFILLYVFPFWGERKVYFFIFCIAFLIK